MRGPVFFVTHPPGTEPLSDRYAGQGLEDLAQWIDVIYKIARPGEVNKDPLLMDIIGKVLPDGILKGKIGMCIASMGVAKHLEPLVPLPEQPYTKYFTGSIPFHHRQWHVCDNCGAFCQGDMWPGGCNMCNGHEGEVYACDCTSEGGSEKNRDCPMHGEYGVMTAEFAEGFIDDSWNAVVTRESAWKGEKVDAALAATKQWSEQLAKQTLSQSTYQTLLNEQSSKQVDQLIQAIGSSSDSSSKDTAGKRMSLVQSSLMGIGGAFTLFGCALIAPLLHPFLTAMIFGSGTALVIASLGQ
jgi:hypothetical protein